MTKLEVAFAEAAKLPPTEQDALAEWILEENVSEKRWTEAFAASPDVLARLAEEALAEHRAGKTHHEIARALPHTVRRKVRGTE